MAKPDQSGLAELAACPMCVGKSGYYYNVIERVANFHTFDGEPCGSQNFCVREHKKYYCSDCGEHIATHRD